MNSALSSLIDTQLIVNHILLTRRLAIQKIQKTLSSLMAEKTLLTAWNQLNYFRLLLLFINELRSIEVNRDEIDC